MTPQETLTATPAAALPGTAFPATPTSSTTAVDGSRAGTATSGMPPALAGHALSWHAQRQPVVDQVSVVVQPGERLGLIGPNGSGKSTLLRLLAGLLTPSHGHVEIEGQPMARLNRRQIARRLAMVSQMGDTLDAITARDAVELGRTPWLSALQRWSPDDGRIVDEALAAVDMWEKKERHWHQLSGGERQRIHIARALAQQPSILLLDEPTNHLDIHHQLALLEMVARLPMTVVMAIHDLNQALRCDRLLMMQDGRLVAEGPPTEVLQPARLAEVFQVQVRMLTDPGDGSPLLRFAAATAASGVPCLTPPHPARSPATGPETASEPEPGPEPGP
ncbi:MAG: ABC transporter ATP-binding protein, partial [Lautropia sp.]|nr:ABC transporter ATP-binding protein [Lautropia sp.]